MRSDLMMMPRISTPQFSQITPNAGSRPRNMQGLTFRSLRLRDIIYHTSILRGLPRVNSFRNSPKNRLNLSGLSMLVLWPAFGTISKGRPSRSAHSRQYFWTLPARSASPLIHRGAVGKNNVDRSLSTHPIMYRTIFSAIYFVLHIPIWLICMD